MHICIPDSMKEGVALYVTYHINLTVHKDLFYGTDTIETAFIEVDRGRLGTSCNVIIGIVYIPPVAPFTNMV